MSHFRSGLVGILLAAGLRLAGGADAPAGQQVAALVREAAALESTDAKLSDDKAREALALARKRNDRKQEIRALYQLGHTLATRRCYPEAMLVAQDGISLASELKDPQQEGEFHRLVSRLHWFEGDLPGTVTSALESLRIAQSIHDPLMEQRAEEMLGVVYLTQEDFGAARSHLEAALRIGLETHSDDVALELDNLASLEKQQKNYPQARVHFEQALSLLRTADPLRVLPTVLCSLGEIALAEGDPASASRYLEESLALATQGDQGVFVAEAQQGLAMLNREQGRLEEARTWLGRSLATAQKYMALDLLEEIYAEFIALAKAQGDYREALEYAGKLAEQTDRVRGEKTRLTISEVQRRYEAQVHAREIDLLRRDRAVQQAELALSKTELDRASTQRLALLAVMLCAGVAVAALVSRQRAHARLTRQDLESTRIAKAAVEHADARKAQLLTLAARELHESEARFRGAFECSALGMALARPDGQWVRVNEALRKILGFDAAEFAGANAFGLTDPADIAEHERLQGCLLRGEIDSYELENRCRRRDGRIVWTLVAASVVRDPDGGRPLYLIAQVQDITQRRQADELLRLAKAEAERANAAKSEFLSRMSHELRTPLNAVLGFGQLLELSAANDRQHECVEHILKAGRHLLELVNEVLDITRIESGELSFVCVPVPLVAAIAEAVELARPLAVQTGVSLRVETGECSPQWVLGDARRLRQVLFNLLTNAIQYNRPEGSVTVSYHAAGPERLRVEISDTGPGIAPEQQADIFTPFTRLAGAQAIKGTGLGLSVSRVLILAMGGRLGVRSELGAGSVFWVELTTCEARADDVASLLAPFPEGPVPDPQTPVFQSETRGQLTAS